MAENVVDRQEISLDGKRYRIAPRRGASVRSFIASRYPGKLVLGDVGSDSDPRRSVVKWTDQRGGLGVYKLDARDPELDRCTYTSCDVRYKGGITLPPLSRYTTGPQLSGDITAIGELNDTYGDGEIYAACGGGTDIRKYNGRTDSWGDSLHTLPGGGNGRNHHLAPRRRRPCAVPRLRARERRVHVHVERDDVQQERQAREVPGVLERPSVGDRRQREAVAGTGGSAQDEQIRLRRRCRSASAVGIRHVPVRGAGPFGQADPLRGNEGRALRSRRREQPVRRDAREMAEARHRRIGRDGLEGRHLRAGRPARVRLLAGAQVVRLRVPTAR